MTGYDLHPDDLLARVNLRTDLLRERAYYGLSCQEVSRRAKFSGLAVVAGLERKTSWDAHRVMQWARGLKRRVMLPIAGLNISADDAAAAVLRELVANAGTTTERDQLYLRLVAHDLIRTRTAMISRSEMGRRCGVNESAIGGWEELPEVGKLRLYQRYARALGGSLTPMLEPITAGVRS